MKFSTKAIHKGGHPDKETGAIMPPIYQTSTYVQETPGKIKTYDYSRAGNPTRDRLEECLASLENGKHAITTSSGMAAATLMMHLFPKGSKILSGDDLYGGTFRLFTKIFGDFHQFGFEDSTNLESFKNSILEFKPNLVWIETPTNPLLKITDIKEVSKVAHSVGAKVIVDNTFLSPYFQNPLNLGADYVLHSTTKYINGHSDVIGGVLVTNSDEDIEKLKYLQLCMGPTPAPFDTWLTLRGVKTLALRMEKHQESASEIATLLDEHPNVEKVIYPGLSSHPQHEICKKQCSGFGGMISFYIKGGLEASRRFLETVEVFSLAESLGGVESLIEHPAIMTHASIPKERREELGIKDNFIRISVGIESIEDLKSDILRALES